ncbi:MAG: manganese efflux pump MntP family protein [Pseudomonadota bacterium]
MFEMLFLAVALSMDAFAVSIGLGAKQQANPKKMALMAAGYFGAFQALMPLFGYLVGKGVLGWVASYAPWVAFILLTLIGAKMIYESFHSGSEENIKNITHKVMLMLAIATSIDAMAAGFVLTLLKVNVLFSCIAIGLITYFFSYVGVVVGAKSGTRLENKAELLGGVVLVLIGVKILLPWFALR